MDQRIAYARSRDNTNIAYAVSGEGPPLVRAGTWLTHVQHDAASPVMAHWLRFMSERHTLIRYDLRGCGLSQASGNNTFADWVDDLEAVVDRNELQSFPLFGMSQGAAIAVEYAIRHPHRVSQLILYAPLVTGWGGRDGAISKRWQSMQQLVSAGWGDSNGAFPSMFAHLFLPESPAETKQWYADLQRKSASKDEAVKFMKVLSELSVFAKLKHVSVPTLVVQVAHDQVIDPSSVAGIAASIPGAEFVSIDSCNHILLEDEAGWAEFKGVFRRYVQGPESHTAEATSVLDGLSKREREILRQIAKGQSNKEIAHTLSITDKTVRNHVTSIFDKLSVSSRAQAIVLAKERGL